ncbi:hypothetical protein DH2020_012979 [Rehmannia glutinosa]|uniref:Peptidase metallopeptidase domain-containing protein n=1 Tax=Rehmannia glutinosa TaxID=99300 RepID=A0ABR0X4H5_REHGL
MTIQVFPYLFLLFYFHSHIDIAHAHLCESRNNVPSPLGFLNQLSQVQKGDNVTGVRELKKHLSYLGYLNYNNTYSNDQKKEHENIFDDSLETALKKYQKFYHLNITGVLDDSTITKMCQPRCGMPDFFNPNNSLPFRTISHYTFFPGNPKWQKKTLAYAFDWNVKEEAKPPLEHALKEWSSVTPFKFYYVKNVSRAEIKFSFMSGDHGDGYPFGDPRGGLGHGFAPPDGRVHFDVNQNWSWAGKRNAFDMKTAGLHELGHVLGLGHSTIVEAIMYPSVHPGERKKLHKDDINGIKALYKLRGK